MNGLLNVARRFLAGPASARCFLVESSLAEALAAYRKPAELARQDQTFVAHGGGSWSLAVAPRRV